MHAIALSLPATINQSFNQSIYQVIIQSINQASNQIILVLLAHTNILSKLNRNDLATRRHEIYNIENVQK